jgi:hypothetical protein
MSRDQTTEDLQKNFVEHLKKESLARSVMEHAEVAVQNAHVQMLCSVFNAALDMKSDWPWVRIRKWWVRRKCIRSIGLHVLSANLHTYAAALYAEIGKDNEQRQPPPN